MTDEFKQERSWLKFRFIMGTCLGAMGGLITGAVGGLWAGSAAFGIGAGAIAFLVVGACGFFFFEILDRVLEFLEFLDDLSVRFWHRTR